MSDRECAVAAYLNARLRPLGLASGLWPVGHWRYASLAPDPCPTVAKSCSLLLTAGDRRLTSHLLEGLDLLLPTIAPHPRAEALRALLPPERRAPANVPIADADGAWGGDGDPCRRGCDAAA